MAHRLLVSRAIGGLFIAAALLGPASTHAQQFPQKPITIVVSASVGGSIDALARQLAPYWEKTLGATFVVQNREGADGITGVRYFMSRPDDGYTILITTEAHVTATAEKAGLKPEEIELINLQQYAPTAWIVLESSRFKSMDDLIKEAREKPDTISWGSPPTGNPRIVGAAVQKAWNLRLRYVPQKSGAATDAALLGGHIDIKAGSASDVAEVKGARVLAVSARERVPFLGDAPTFNELVAKLKLGGTIPNLGTGRLIAVRSSLKSKRPEIFKKLAESYERAFHNPAYQDVLKKTGQSLVTQFRKPADATAQFRELVSESIKNRKTYRN